MARPNPRDDDYPFTSAPTEQTEVPVAPKETRPSPRTDEGGFGTTQAQQAGTTFSTFTQSLGLVFGPPTPAATNKNTQSATNARNDTNPTPANDNVLDEQPNPKTEIEVASDAPTYEVEETEIADADYGLPTNGVSETDYGIPDHVDPTLINGDPWFVQAREFYNNNKSHLAIAIGVAGLFLASSKLKRRT